MLVVGVHDGSGQLTTVAHVVAVLDGPRSDGGRGDLGSVGGVLVTELGHEILGQTATDADLDALGLGPLADVSGSRTASDEGLVFVVLALGGHGLF